MIEKKFIQEGIKKAKLEEFLEVELRRANYSHIDITKTPTSTNIVIWSEKPSLVIGRGGHHINEIIDRFENEFNIENPQVDAQEVEEPDLDANVVAKNIAGWLEKGGHPKRVGNVYARRVMQAGAVGVQIEIAGKLSGSRGRSEKFIDGYVKKCGDTAREFVDESYEKAVTKPGALGVKVKIMKDMPEHMKRSLQEEGMTAEEIKQAAEEEAAAKIDYDELVQENVADIKEAVREHDDVDFRRLVDAEKEHKNRSTLVSWLEGRLEQQQETSDAEEESAEEAVEEVVDEEDEAEADDVDYDALVEENISDIKDAVESGDADPAKVLEAETNNKDRVTLVDWLESRVEE